LTALFLALIASASAGVDELVQYAEGTPAAALQCTDGSLFETPMARASMGDAQIEQLAAMGVRLDKGVDLIITTTDGPNFTMAMPIELPPEVREQMAALLPQDGSVRLTDKAMIMRQRQDMPVSGTSGDVVGAVTNANTGRPCVAAFAPAGLMGTDSEFPFAIPDDLISLLAFGGAPGMSLYLPAKSGGARAKSYPPRALPQVQLPLFEGNGMSLALPYTMSEVGTLLGDLMGEEFGEDLFLDGAIDAVQGSRGVVVTYAEDGGRIGMIIPVDKPKSPKGILKRVLKSLPDAAKDGEFYAYDDVYFTATKGELLIAETPAALQMFLGERIDSAGAGETAYGAGFINLSMDGIVLRNLVVILPRDGQTEIQLRPVE
jgi:hypothetical protein